MASDKETDRPEHFRDGRKVPGGRIGYGKVQLAMDRAVEWMEENDELR